MNAVPFDVNDTRLRRMFLYDVVPALIAGVGEDTHISWGNMSAQHIVEHLLWAFEGSMGTVDVVCNTPEAVLDRARRFLYDNRQTPRDVRNPMLGKDPPPLRFATLHEAKAALMKGLSEFSRYAETHPAATHIHPLFGPCGMEEWERSHFKHCYHHLLQLGLIEGGIPVPE
jgi:hypothetical protein